MPILQTSLTGTAVEFEPLVQVWFINSVLIPRAKGKLEVECWWLCFTEFGVHEGCFSPCSILPHQLLASCWLCRGNAHATFTQDSVCGGIAVKAHKGIEAGGSDA